MTEPTTGSRGRRGPQPHHRTMCDRGWTPDAEFPENRYTRDLGDARAIVLKLYPRGWGWRVEARPWPPGMSGSMRPGAEPYPNRMRAADAALDVAEARQRALEKGSR